MEKWKEKPDLLVILQDRAVGVILGTQYIYLCKGSWKVVQKGLREAVMNCKAGIDASPDDGPYFWVVPGSVTFTAFTL